MLMFECESCKTKLKVADEHAGKTIACPKCKTKSTVPIPVEPAVEVAIVEPDVIQPERKRTRKRSRDDDEGHDTQSEPDIGYPSIVGLAAVAWILFGCLILLNGGVSVLQQLTQGAGDAAGANMAGGICGMAIVLLFGFAFIFVGGQTLRGTATDTLGNSIGSLVIGLLILGCGGAAFVGGGAAANGQIPVGALIRGIVNVASGFGLFAAGVMALIGRAPYGAWRRDQAHRS